MGEARVIPGEARNLGHGPSGDSSPTARNDKPRFLRTLTGKTLLRLALAGGLLLLAAAAFNAYLLYRQSEGEATLRLSAAAAERARVAERVLGYTVETHETVRLAFVEKWSSYQNDAVTRRFETLLALYPDGVWRNRKEFADGRVHPTGWIPKKTPLSDELRRLMVLFWDLSRHYGPGAAIRRDNLFFMGVPEESNLGYDPYLFPNWVFDIPTDFSQLDYEWGRLAYAPARPGERSRFATPLVDDIGPDLGPIFQVLTPIHLGERHIATVATTLLFKDFLARAMPGAPGAAGATPKRDQRYLVFKGDGRLLADTRAADIAAPSAARANLAALGDGLAAALLAGPQARGETHTGYVAADDLYYAAARIDGPDWYVAAVLPGAAVRADALRVALTGSAAHIAVLLVLLALLAFILRRQVAAPLGELTQAAERVAAGDMDVRLPSGRDDELGRLALAFNDMAGKVAERDARLRQDKQEIEAAMRSLVATEQQLRQAQKLEAIGTLAGGIAHDFNNILAAILGYGEMAQKDAAPGSAQRRHIDAALAAGARAKSLVERILAFSRSGIGTRVPVHVQAVVEEALELIAGSLPPGIRLERTLDAGDAAVLGDPTQVHQVVMNLCANAVQAMKAHGTLAVLLDRAALPATAITTGTLRAGTYVRLAVRDTGTGIEPAVLERIFDPFFTTKEIGVGTGLGLSLVHGIAADLGGGIDIASQMGAGSTFTVYLPWHGTTARPRPAQEQVHRGAGETVLLVDDEEPLVRLGEEMLAELGYEPVGFASSSAALAAFRAAPERFHVVLSDEAMPGMTGSELAAEIRRIRPDIPIIIMSGYVSPALTQRARDAGVHEVLSKPLVSRDIARSLAGALQAPLAKTSS